MWRTAVSDTAVLAWAIRPHLRPIRRRERTRVGLRGSLRHLLSHKKTWRRGGSIGASRCTRRGGPSSLLAARPHKHQATAMPQVDDLVVFDDGTVWFLDASARALVKVSW